MSRYVLITIFFLMTTTVSVAAEGILLDVSLPITGKSSHAVARVLERTVQELHRSKDSVQKNGATNTETGPQPTVVIQFRVGSDQEQFGRGSSFGACYELSSLILGEKFQGVRTVAYFPQSVRGHALLLALACDERVAAEDVEIGQAGIDETSISATQREAYHEVAGRRRSVPSALVDKLLDPATELIQIETEKGIRLVSPTELEELRKTETFAEEPVTLVAAGAPGLFTADTARKINLVDLIAADRVALARGLGFRPDEIKNAPVPGELGHAVRVNVSGLITNDNTGSAIRSIQSALEPMSNPMNHRPVGTAKVDFLCVCIDSPGGNVEASLNLASYLVRNIDATKVRTVAYVPFQARSDAALIALACDEIVLGPTAVLGGDGAVEFSKQQLDDARRTVRQFLSKESLRSWSLPVGFVDKDIEVYEMTRQGRPPLIDYFCDEELREQPDAELWRRGDMVKRKGVLFKVDAARGERQLVDRTARDFAEFKFLYGLENDPLLVEPGWADKLVRMLSSPGMSAMILLIVFIAAFTESNSPGLGIGAFIALVGIVLFFWLNFLGGTAGWLEVTLFLTGVACLLLEIFVLPGFGIFGLGGAAAIIASLVLASQTFVIPQNSYQFDQFRNSLLILCVSGGGMLLLGAVISRALDRANKPKDAVFINETEKLASYDHLLGMSGVTTTPLVPAGKALIHDEPINVVSDGELIEKGVRVKVVEVVGYRVVVGRF